WVVFSFALSITGDAALTVTAMLEEESAYSAAVQANGQVIAADIKQLWNGHYLYTLTCRFPDAQGAPHHATFFTSKSELPAEVERAIAGGQLPVALSVSYDPSWPGRNWMTVTRDPHHNRLHFLSFATIFFSVLLAFGFLEGRRESPHKRLPPEK